MIINHIYCQNYRNISSAEIDFGERTNVLYGSNAQGKTNILESIYYFACGKSFRACPDKELVKLGSDFAKIGIEFSDAVRKRKHEVVFPSSGRKSCFKEGIRITKISEFIGSFRAVLFSPEHLSIVKDGPAERRNFEDIAISQLKPEYLSALSRYQKILADRNAVLKDQEPNKDMLYILSERLAHESAYIAKERLAYTKKLSEHVKTIIDDMTSGREFPEISYNCGMTEDEYLKKLTQNTEKELRAGSTLYGTHRDDIPITLNGNDSRIFASQGQQRSIALAMKLAEGEISKDESGEYPVFLFDDILSELDKSRKEYILSGLGERQVIITCCEEIPIGKIFTVKSGSIE